MCRRFQLGGERKLAKTCSPKANFDRLANKNVLAALFLNNLIDKAGWDKGTKGRGDEGTRQGVKCTSVQDGFQTVLIFFFKIYLLKAVSCHGLQFP